MAQPRSRKRPITSDESVLWVTVAEAARMCSVSEDTMLRLINDRTIPASDIGRGRARYRVSVAKLSEYMENLHV